MERHIVTIDTPIDPNDMGDDGGTLPLDPSKIVTDVTKDPRGGSFTNQLGNNGVTVLMPEGPPLGMPDPRTMVRQLKPIPAPAPGISKADQEVADFLMSLGISPAEGGIPVASAADIPELDDLPHSGQPVAYRAAPRPAEPGEMEAALGAAVATGDDVLERSKKKAYTLLAMLPPGCELFVGGVGSGPAAVELAMGLGILLGAGLAAYRGNGHYRLKMKEPK